MDGFGGSVFLADLDADFISPSQACVNPLFTGTAKKKGSINDQIKQTNPKKKVPISRRIVRICEKLVLLRYQ